ncbi:cysteine dioxygenase [Paenibacillus silviterrae]|uniref:cysteine dioxygenase n=1 Tax=Paenibacillus silviterrae TaxID=3242194 RepID=UPI002543F6FF|nr:cysteine dioxygenase family protein [Paenibacillus chinjuensis]
MIGEDAAVELIKRIEATFAGVTKPTPHEIRALIQSLKLTAEELEEHVSDPGELSYGRTVLYQNEEVDVILIHLPPGGETRIHDHGESSGCAMVVEGAVMNCIYKLDSYGYPHLQAEHPVVREHFLYAPKWQIHQLQNPHAVRSLSVHVYAPSMRGNRAYLPYEQVLDFVI